MSRTTPSIKRHCRSRTRGLFLAAALATGAGAFHPVAARAASDDLDGQTDGRLESYGNKKVGIEKSSSTPSFLLFGALVIIGCVPLFKAAKRD
jgi:hypothetical protein